MIKWIAVTLIVLLILLVLSSMLDFVIIGGVCFLLIVVGLGLLLGKVI